ncbi:class I SAM-dependent methyltransferase [Rhabdobacter roseus]
MDHLRDKLPKQPLRILNVGVATGHTSELLREFGSVESIEYDEECYAFTKKNVLPDLIQGSILELPSPDQVYDLVCAFDVIEHVEEHQKAVEEMKRVCRPDGLVCVTVPAFNFLWNQHDDVNHHIRRYTKSLLTSLFRKRGQILFSSYFNFWLFFPIAAFRVLSKILPFHQRSVEEAGSDFTVMSGSVFQKLFYGIFYSETVLLKRGIRLPVGVSLLLSWKKNNALSPVSISK